MSDDKSTRLKRFRSLFSAVAIALGLSMLGYCTTAAAAPTNAAPSEAAPTKLATYVGSKTCIGCHKESAHTFSATMMGKIFFKNARDEQESRGCETCHGPGSLYIKDMQAAMGKGIMPGHRGEGPSKNGLITFRKDSGESAKTDNGVCLTCHEGGARAFWQASTHAERGLRCADCHTIMRKISPRFQLAVGRETNPFQMKQAETQVCLRCHLRKRMQINLPSHMPIREGLMTCTDCHNPHGGPYQHQLVRATVNEVCYQCHAERRGPFLWPHPPVMINCLNCHTPHGSVNRFLLKVRAPRLCQQCHIGTYHPGDPRAANQPFVFNRACLNCHQHIHGSNSPGGRVFTR